MMLVGRSKRRRSCFRLFEVRWRTRYDNYHRRHCSLFRARPLTLQPDTTINALHCGDRGSARVDVSNRGEATRKLRYGEEFNARIPELEERDGQSQKGQRQPNPKQVDEETTGHDKTPGSRKHGEHESNRGNLRSVSIAMVLAQRRVRRPRRGNISVPPSTCWKPADLHFVVFPKLIRS